MERLEVVSGVIEIAEITIQPIGEYASEMSDKELIEDISLYEARREYYRYSINAATVAFYESIINEWKKRYGDKHIPRVAYTKKQIYKMYNMEF
jgi:hypothetical protein